MQDAHLRVWDKWERKFFLASYQEALSKYSAQRFLLMKPGAPCRGSQTWVGDVIAFENELFLVVPDGFVSKSGTLHKSIDGVVISTNILEMDKAQLEALDIPDTWLISS